MPKNHILKFSFLLLLGFVLENNAFSENGIRIYNDIPGSTVEVYTNAVMDGGGSCFWSGTAKCTGEFDHGQNHKTYTLAYGDSSWGWVEQTGGNCLSPDVYGQIIIKSIKLKDGTVITNNGHRVGDVNVDDPSCGSSSYYNNVDLDSYNGQNIKLNPIGDGTSINLCLGNCGK